MRGRRSSALPIFERSLIITSTPTHALQYGPWLPYVMVNIRQEIICSCRLHIYCKRILFLLHVHKAQGLQFCSSHLSGDEW